MIRQITDELIDAAEDGKVQKWKSKCNAAGVPEPIAKELVTGARYPGMCKKGLKISSPHLVADAMNSLGVSAKYRHHILFGKSLATLLVHNRKMQSKFDAILEELKTQRKVIAPEQFNPT